jgi:DNA helicase-2/ATP-dependent DNA helicase PcrA
VSTTVAGAALPSLEAILAGRNDEQRVAITHGEGPLLIVAGAGTGKTAVITRRIAWLIATKRARPEEILALTFTEKAASEMEARVDELVPYGYVGATISTFHAFCDRLVREHAIELGLTSQLRVDSDAEILVFLRERLFDLGLKRFAPLGNPDTHLADLVAVFDRARDEDVTPEEYRAFAGRLAAEAGDDPAKRDRAGAELEKGNAYAVYQKLLLENGRMDFGAQIALALRLLRERAHLRRELQEGYRYILVDEFQDTNHVQFELVKLLAGTGAGAPRNLTVVGDDDQSIYRFRGAKIENLLGFVDAYPDARVQVLNRNYRSGQAILDRAYRLIQNNNPQRLEHTLGYDKHLKAARGEPGVVELRAFQTASDEADVVVAEIATAIERGERAARDFAILTRAHRSLDPFALALKARGLPFRRIGRKGLYSRPEVMVCLNVLRTVADPADGGAAYHVLGDTLFGADPVDLARIGAGARRYHRGLLELAGSMARDQQLTERTREAVARFTELHRRLAASALRRTTAEVLYEFVSESGLLGTLTAQDTPEAVERAQNLNKLFGMVSRVGPLLRRDRVDQFIPHLDLLIEMGDDPSAVEIEGDEEAVHLLTAHNAKGLEFPVVYLAHLVEGRFPRYRQSSGLPFPPELKRGLPEDPEDHYREERRLFYVGLTRAKDRLVLTHAIDYGGRRSAKVSRFVLEALELPALPKGTYAASALESIARHAPVAEPEAPGIAPIPEDQTLQLSNSQIDDYHECPLKYRFAHIMSLPLAIDPAFMYGNAIHNAIRDYLKDRLRGYPTAVEHLIRTYEESWSSSGFISREHEERRLEEGRQVLRRFYTSEETSPLKPSAVEREFRFRLEQNEVRGRWDRIDDRPEGVVLVDYKTSEVDDAEKADERALKSLKENQLGLYALAYREMTGAPPRRVELHFVSHGLVGAAEVGPDHLDRAEHRIRDAARGIRAAEFPPDPDQRKCGYCPYSRFCVHSAARGGA